ncbi:DMT family transporter [Sphingomonas pruni]|uniref:DMT family transporter n=1 Tax=Sphingomonas pruni TaxID=40683 RepID=UPI00082BE2B8|nr:DMT family transporter [Sphingomonas pruni]
MTATLAPLFMIASGSIHAVVNAIVKGGKDKMASRAMTDGSAAIILLPALLFVPLPLGAWTWLLATALVHALYLYALIRAYQVSDFSSAYPVLRGTAPLVTAAVTLGLLGDHVSTVSIAGIALIGISMFVLAIGRHLSRAGFGWAVLTGFTIAAYTVIDAAGVRAAPTPFSYIAWMFVTMGLVIVGLFAILTRGTLFASMREQWRPGAIAGALSIMTYGLALYALSIGPTAPLAALRETGMVTALIIAVVFLKERVTVARAMAVLGILAGAGLILRG